MTHVGFELPLVGYINSPVKAAPHTLANIEATGVYTIKPIRPDFAE